MRTTIFVVSLFIVTSLFGQVAPTRCQTSSDTVMGSVPVKVLLGCSDSLPDDVLWHLDRVDQVSGSLDGHAWLIAGFDATSSLPGRTVACPTPEPALQPCASSPPELSVVSHGTATASAAAGANVGVAPEASIVSVRTVGVYAPGISLQTLSDGLDYVIRNAWDPATPQFRTGIVSLSFAIAYPSDTDRVTAADVEAKIRRMIGGVDRDGNADPNGKRFFFSILTGNANQIGMTRDNKVWSNSCRGEEVFAPAEELFVASSTAHNHYRGPNARRRSGPDPRGAGGPDRELALEAGDRRDGGGVRGSSDTGAETGGRAVGVEG